MSEINEGDIREMDYGKEINELISLSNTQVLSEKQKKKLDSDVKFILPKQKV